MDTKPTSSSMQKKLILRGSCTGRLSSESLKAMEEALDHADKLTVTMEEVDLGECDFTPPTLDEMDKSLMLVGVIRRGDDKAASKRTGDSGQEYSLRAGNTSCGTPDVRYIIPTLNIPPGTMSFSMDKGIVHEFTRSKPVILRDSYAAAITEKPIYRIPEYHRSKKKFFSKPDPDDIRPRKLLTGKQKAKRSAKNKMQKISRMNNRRK